MKLRSLILVNASTMASLTPGKKFLWNERGFDYVTFIKFGKSIDYGKSHPRSKNFPSKEAWSW